MYTSYHVRTRRCRTAAAIVALPGLLAAGPAPATETNEDATRDLFDLEVVAEGLEVPWALDFAKDGRLFISERPGRIRVVENGTLRTEPWARLRVAEVGESGLMGLVLDPEFETNRYVYACHTYYQNEQGLLGNRVVRLREVDGKGAEEETLLDAIPGALFHDGCRLRFGPDGRLYVTTGDARLEETAQDTRSLAGKILRINADGSIPAGNPFPGSPVWSYGHRNPQGVAWQPGTGRLFATEHGTGGVNEVNVIRAGGNYGWPVEREGESHPSFDDPLLKHDGPPAGAVFVSGHVYPRLFGNFLFVTLATEDLRRLVLSETQPPAVERMERHLTGVLGRLRDIVQGPDGYLYVATSNRDGRGGPAPGDDRVVRLLPADER
jgi:glucose/arabinose dehydrogenase